MNTDAIITADDLAAARARLRADTVGRTMDTLAQTEPDVFGFVMTSINCVAGRLALFDTPNPVVRDTADEMLQLVLTCLMAQRDCQARLWSDAGASDGGPTDPHTT